MLRASCSALGSIFSAHEKGPETLVATLLIPVAAGTANARGGTCLREWNSGLSPDGRRLLKPPALFGRSLVGGRGSGLNPGCLLGTRAAPASLALGRPCPHWTRRVVRCPAKLYFGQLEFCADFFRSLRTIVSAASPDPNHTRASILFILLRARTRRLSQVITRQYRKTLNLEPKTYSSTTDHNHLYEKNIPPVHARLNGDAEHECRRS